MPPHNAAAQLHVIDGITTYISPPAVPISFFSMADPARWTKGRKGGMGSAFTEAAVLHSTTVVRVPGRDTIRRREGKWRLGYPTYITDLPQLPLLRPVPRFGYFYYCHSFVFSLQVPPQTNRTERLDRRLSEGTRGVRR